MADKSLQPQHHFCPITMNPSRTVFYTTLICSLLAACGGGGGGGNGGSSGTTNTSPPQATLSASSFSNLTLPPGFAWTSQQGASTSGITITQSSGAVLGNIRVTVSNFIEADPTGGGGPIAAMSTDVLTYALGGSTSGPSDTILFGRLVLPSGTQHVLIEVFSAADGSRLGAQIFSVPVLLAGTAGLVL